MKRLFLIVILSMAVAASVGQTKKGFAKISPGVMIPDKGNESFAAFISGGPTIGRYVAAGPSFGYFKTENKTQYTGAQPHTVITTGTSTIKQYFISIEFML
jgi:hypothetical protein